MPEPLLWPARDMPPKDITGPSRSAGMVRVGEGCEWEGERGGDGGGDGGKVGNWELAGNSGGPFFSFGSKSGKVGAGTGRVYL